MAPRPARPKSCRIQKFNSNLPRAARCYCMAMESEVPDQLTFWARVKLAFRIIFNFEFAQQTAEALRIHLAPKTPQLPERTHASGLFLLSALQREGRLIDFLQQDVAAFPDAEVGAAARVVHAGCRKVFGQYFSIEAALSDPEGAAVTVPKGFDAQRIRLTGNVAGHPPYKGSLQHHGWVVTELRLPSLQESVDPRVIAPAEVELT
jgi:hypothetical protein